MVIDLKRFVTKPREKVEVAAEAQSNKAQQREVDLFAKMPLTWSAVGTEALGSRQSFILVWLQYLAWKHKNLTFPVSNVPLARYGINRWMKYRALAKLEAAGLIKVEYGPGRATIVTLLNT